LVRGARPRLTFSIVSFRGVLQDEELRVFDHLGPNLLLRGSLAWMLWSRGEISPRASLDH